MIRMVASFRADTRLCRALIGAVNVLIRLVWRPSLATADRLARIAGGLVWVREVVETKPEDGFRTYRPGRGRVSLPLGPAA